MKNKNKCCEPKGCRKPQDRYCGEDLECIGVVKGDTFNDALVKINDVVCNGGQNICDISVNIEAEEELVEGEFKVTLTGVGTGGSGNYEFTWSLDQYTPQSIPPQLSPNGDQLEVTFDLSDRSVCIANINLVMTDIDTGCTISKNFIIVRTFT